MRIAASGLVLTSVALWLGACTADFGSFEFASDEGDRSNDGSVQDGDAGGGDPMSGAGGAGAGGAGEGGAGEGGAGGSVANDAGSGGTGGGGGDAGEAGHGSGGVGGEIDAGNTGGDGGDGGGAAQDASMPEEDAEVPMPDECAATWEGAGLEANACETCACAECSSSIDACLSAGSPTDQARCAAVLECAIANDCKDWTCYCTSPSCGSPNPSGNGPCATEMNAAANGMRTAVMSIREGGDTGEPLVRAMNAISCVLGLDSRSPGGPRTGQCDSACP